MESGCIDLWGGDLREGAGSPREAIAGLAADRPDHPYSLAGLRALEEGLTVFRRLTEEAGYPYRGSIDRNYLIPTALGTLKPTGLVPPTMTAGHAPALTSLLVVGIDELKDSYPALAAENLSAVLNIPIRSASVAMNCGDFRELTPVQVANLLDDPDQRRAFWAKIAKVHRDEAAVALPPVLALTPSLAVLEEGRQALKSEIFEVPSISPSVPGMRLDKVLDRALKAARVRLVKAETMEGFRKGGRVTGVRLRSLAGDGEVLCKALVLATGGLAGGAFEFEERGSLLRERVLKLPVKAGSDRGSWTRPDWFDPLGQPLSLTGVAADNQLRPLGDDGLPELENVFLAGRILANQDPDLEKCGNGVAVATGYKAGLLAAEVSGI